MNSIPTHIVRSLVAAAALASVTLALAQQQPAPQQTHPGQHNPSTSDATVRSGSMNANASSGRELSRADRNFIEKAAEANMKEIEVSQAVLGRVTAPSVQQFAQMMVSEHTAATAELQTLAAQKGVALTRMSDRHTEKWSDKTRNLDKDYVEEMEEDHKKSIELFDKAAKSDDADIAAFAQKMLPKLQQHQEHLRSQIKPALGR